MIIRGTTPYHRFILPLSVEDIETVYVTYAQNNEVILDKSNITDEFEIEDIVEEAEESLEEANELEEQEEQEETEEVEVLLSSQLTLHLTQEDTLKFHFYPAARKNIAVIQIRILKTNGEAIVSMPINERVFGALHDGVISSEENNG